MPSSARALASGPASTARPDVIRPASSSASSFARGSSPQTRASSSGASPPARFEAASECSQRRPARRTNPGSAGPRRPFAVGLTPPRTREPRDRQHRVVPIAGAAAGGLDRGVLLRRQHDEVRPGRHRRSRPSTPNRPRSRALGVAQPIATSTPPLQADGGLPSYVPPTTATLILTARLRRSRQPRQPRASDPSSACASRQAARAPPPRRVTRRARARPAGTRSGHDRVRCRVTRHQPDTRSTGPHRAAADHRADRDAGTRAARVRNGATARIGQIETYGLLGAIDQVGRWRAPLPAPTLSAPGPGPARRTLEGNGVHRPVPQPVRATLHGVSRAAGVASQHVRRRNVLAAGGVAPSPSCGRQACGHGGSSGFARARRPRPDEVRPTPRAPDGTGVLAPERFWRVPSPPGRGPTRAPRRASRESGRRRR